MVTRTRPLVGLGLGLSLAIACGMKPEGQGPGNGTPPAPAAHSAAPSALQAQLAAMTPAEPRPPSDAQKRLGTALENYYKVAATRRYYMQLDKPLYKPGETIWFRVFEQQTASLANAGEGHGIRAELVSPKGATVIDKRIRVDKGVAHNDFILPASVQGGEYKLRVTSDYGGTAERPVIVSQYQPPQIKKKAEWLRKAYGPGDKAMAAVSLSRATGEPFANQKATALVVVDEAEVARVAFTTNDEGKATVKFDLPGRIARGDGLMTLLVNDGGVTESLQKRIPIIMKEIGFEMFPEGGQLVTGLPGRVYFRAVDLIGKPADVEGRVVDSSGNLVTRFSSLHNGLGKFEITPAKGVSYFAEFDKPATVTQRTPLPAAEASGCSMQALDDYASARKELRVAVWCTSATSVIAAAQLRERKLGEQLIEVAGGAPQVVAFPVAPGSQGAIRVTVFNDRLEPMAERLVYRGRGSDLTVKVRTDRKTYAPRDKVELTVETRDLAGKPVAADLALAVVDDTVLSFADDKNAHMLARLYLESEMPGQEIEEPNFYFSDDPKAAAGLDLVLGTQGWRRFEWQKVWNPPRPAVVTATGGAPGFADDDLDGMELAEAEGADMPVPAAAPPRDRAQRAPMKLPAAPPPPAEAAIAPRGEVRKAEKKKVADFRRRPAQDPAPEGDGAMAKDEEWAGKADEARNRWAWAPVRVFPRPTYDSRYDGPRVDFRETVFWAPQVTTSDEGTARVSFYLSDAVTSFRATAEGLSAGGLPGRGELVVASKLPVSLAVKMPLEVSRGDRVRLPITLSNETDRRYDVAVSTVFGSAFKVVGGVPDKVTLDAGKRQAFFAELEVVGDGKDAAAGEMKVAIETSNLKDEVGQTIKVVPLGFPLQASAAGTLERSAKHSFDLGQALPGSIDASLTLYPSPLATMVKGTEAMLREPSGCFEQASSTNYPNIMILGYMEEHDAAEPALVEKTMGMLDRGYKKLAGYESKSKGYEWFGGDPGHEALTAYGLMEFADMTRVYGDVDKAMIARTAAWLKKRRDGKGGFQRNARALDSFGRASEEVTNGYITYALSEAGEKDLSAELAYQKKIAETSSDPYVLALAANTLLNIEPRAASTGKVVGKLVGLQKPSGVWDTADHSITRSGGVALQIETTSLAAMALIKAGDRYQSNVRKGIDWLNANRSGYGSFSSTQATVLGLKAMTTYASASRKTTDGGTVHLIVNGKAAGQLSFEKGHRDPLVFDDFAALLRPGKNQVELRLDSGASLPYSVAIDYRSKKPASAPETAVRLSTELAKKRAPMGESVRMKVVVENVTDKGQPMTMARVGLPGGLAFQTWQLEELVDKKLIDFYETREREVVLYFRSMAPKSAKKVDLDLIARVPGTYVAPASQAYLYYTDEYKHWVEPVTITIDR